MGFPVVWAATNLCVMVVHWGCIASGQTHAMHLQCKYQGMHHQRWPPVYMRLLGRKFCLHYPCCFCVCATTWVDDDFLFFLVVFLIGLGVVVPPDVVFFCVLTFVHSLCGRGVTQRTVFQMYMGSLSSLSDCYFAFAHVCALLWHQQHVT